MGCWGYGLFQSDSDLDLVCEIDEIARRHLPPTIESLQYPNDPSAARAALDAGALDKIYKDLGNKPITYLVYLFVMAMQLGCKISDWQREALGELVTMGGFYDVAQEQVAKALKEYKEGEAYDFNSLGLLDTMSLKAAGVDDEQLGKFMMTGNEEAFGLKKEE